MIQVSVYRVNKAKPLVYLADTMEQAQAFRAGVIEHGLTFSTEGKSVYWPSAAIVEISLLESIEPAK